jgi:NADPH-dependent 2,4-dienoyl-CoA reductase/sulfur reductase-like enzyme
MMEYVIVGNGVAGIEAAFQIRKRWGPEEASITVISDETDYFFSRTALMYAYMNKMQRRDLEPHDRAVYERQSIELVRDRVVDIDAHAGAITLRDGGSRSFDRLLLAVGAKPRMIPWPGVDETDDGIVHLVSMQDLDACERLTWSTDEAVVVGGGLIGVELVECLQFHGVDVTFLVREPYFWPAGLHQEEGEMIQRHIASHGVDVRMGEELAEVIPDADGRVEAITTDSGERIPCQRLGIAIGVTPRTDWLDDVTTPPSYSRGIEVDRGFQTDLDNVWAAGDCCEIAFEDERRVETIWYTAERHGRLAGRSMLGDEVTYDPPVFFNSSKFFEIEYTTVGTVADAPAGTKTLFRRMPGEEITQRIVVDDSDRVIGFNMLGSRWEHTILQQWIRQRRPLDWVLDRLSDAQFDVEFGRVPLEKMNEEIRRL